MEQIDRYVDYPLSQHVRRWNRTNRRDIPEFEKYVEDLAQYDCVMNSLVLPYPSSWAHVDFEHDVVCHYNGRTHTVTRHEILCIFSSDRNERVLFNRFNRSNGHYLNVYFDNYVNSIRLNITGNNPTEYRRFIVVHPVRNTIPKSDEDSWETTYIFEIVDDVYKYITSITIRVADIKKHCVPGTVRLNKPIQQFIIASYSDTPVLGEVWTGRKKSPFQFIKKKDSGDDVFVLFYSLLDALDNPFNHEAGISYLNGLLSTWKENEENLIVPKSSSPIDTEFIERLKALVEDYPPTLSQMSRAMGTMVKSRANLSSVVTIDEPAPTISMFPRFDELSNEEEDPHQIYGSYPIHMMHRPHKNIISTPRKFTTGNWKDELMNPMISTTIDK